MENLWKSRVAPNPIKWGEFNDSPAAENGATTQTTTNRDQKVWTTSECANVLSESLAAIKKDFGKLPEGDNLVWDKDDKHAMDFVAACANIRSKVFGIAQKSRFEIKCKFI